jgi:hydroxyethylthiazole kinase-like uncharacterized protein yjeF
VATRWIEDAPELLTVAQMYRADAAAIAGGVAGLDLMEAAGAAIAETVQAGWPEGEVLVLCGPGNNGGDGFVAARLLAVAGRRVRLALLGSPDKLDGDAAANAARWASDCNGEIESLAPSLLEGVDVVIDALFGAGLGRPLDGVALEMVAALNGSGVPCVAVDVPSGVHGDTGEVMGTAAQATTTVTFFRRKPGHVLYPGRGLCGDVRVADIGIPVAVLDEIAPGICENLPSLWRDLLPRPQPESHKYTRGQAVISGGGVLTGAARLASYAALRAGAGLVTIAAPAEAGDVYRAGRPTTMVRDIADGDAFTVLLSEPKVTAALIGPGNGVTAETADRVLRGLAAQPCVLDADALTVFADQPETLFAALSAATAGASVLTPHEGEFARLFPGETGDGGKIERTVAAAALANATVLLKGPDTVIASPDGRIAVNTNAPPYLATAGSGDVLAGYIVGLMAQGLPAYDAACAGAWFHGACAVAFGPGLIADDLADMLPDVLRGVLK